MIQEYSIYIFYAALFIVCFFFGMLLRKLMPRKNGAAKIDETPKKSRKKSRKDTVTMAEVDAMKGYEFEHFCADLLKKNGFRKVSVTPASGDQGVDIIAVRGTARYAIQCKRYASPLGNKPVQEVYTGKAFSLFLKMLREGAFEEDENIVFLHSGGAGGLFAIDLP